MLPRQQGFPSRLFLVLCLGLTFACGGGGGGTPPGTQTPPQVAIIEPAEGAFLNTAQPRLLLEYSGSGLDLAGLRVFVNDEDRTLELTERTSIATGSTALLPMLPDGVHRIEVRVSGTLGEASTVRGFETSTGGGTTVLRGQLLDPEGNVPIPGARIYLDEDPGRSVLTDAEGAYRIEDALAGSGLHLIFDPSGLRFPDEQGGTYAYPVYNRRLDVVAGATNQTASCFLPKVRVLVTFAELEELGVFQCALRRFIQPYTLATNLGGDPTRRVELRIPASPTAPIYVSFLDSSVDSCEEIGAQYLSIAAVDEDTPPSNLPPGTDPSDLITVQPTGMKFHTLSWLGPLARLPISFANRDELAPGTELTLFSVNHETGQFQAMGTMEVSELDPTRIVTIDGGLQGGSWHCACPPGLPCAPQGDNDADPMDCAESVAVNPRVQLRTGLVTESFELPARRVFDETFGSTLVYSSAAVVPTAIERLAVTIPQRAAVPPKLSIAATIAGIPAGPTVWYDARGFPENADTALNLGYEFDLAGLSTGAHAYELAVTSHYGTSSATSFIRGTLDVVRGADSAFGRGWSLAGDDRIVAANESRATLMRSDGSSVHFGPDQGSGLRLRIFDDATDTSLASFFAGQPGDPFIVRRASTAPETVLEFNVPNVDFRDVPGRNFWHAGADGIPGNDPDGSTTAQPTGDDLVFTTPENAFGALLEGFLEIPDDGTYSFTLCIDDGCYLEIDGTVVLAHPQNQAPSHFSSTPHFFTAGWKPIRVAFNDAGDRAALTLKESGGTCNAGTVIPPSRFRSGPAPSGPLTLRGTAGDFSRLTRIEDGTWLRELSDGGTETYDTAGRIAARTDRRGRVTRYERDPSGRITRRIDPAGGATEFVYSGTLVSEVRDSAERSTRLVHTGTDLTSIVDASGASWGFGYSSSGLLTSTQDADGPTNTHRYDARGRYLETTFADGTKQSITAAARLGLAAGSSSQSPAAPLRQSSFVSTHDDELQRRRRVANDLATGSFSIFDALGAARTLQRDPSTRLPLVSVEVDGATRVTQEWDVQRGLLLSTIEHGNTSDPSDDRKTTYEWHAEHAWLMAMTRAYGTPLAYRIEFRRDARGNVTEMREPFAPGQPAITTFTYDAALGDVLTSITDPDGVHTDFSHDHPSGSTTAITVDGVTTILELNAAGMVERSTAPAPSNGGLAVTRTLRDPLGRVRHVIDAEGGDTEYFRSAAGRMLWVRDAKTPPGENAPRNVFEYDLRGRLRRWLDPLESAANPAHGVRYTYTPTGLLATTVDHEGHVTTNSYDALGRLTRVEYRAANNAPVTDWSEFTYTTLGQLRLARNPTSEVELAYGPHGETVQERQRLDNEPEAVVDSTIDRLGRRTRMQARLGTNTFQDVTYVFDATSHRLEEVRGGPVFGTAVLSTSPGGRRTSLQRPNALTTTWSYDPGSGQLQSVVNRIGTTVISRDDITFDSSNTIASIADLRVGAVPEASTTDYTHDRLGRLVSSSNSLIEGMTQSYAPYDAVGNRRTNTHVYDAADRMLSDGRFTYTYDRNGNQLTRHDTTGATPDRLMVWNLRRQLVRTEDGGSQTFTATYDALGRRVLASSSRALYDRQRIIAGATATNLAYVRLNGDGINDCWSELDASTQQTRIQVTDALGSIVGTSSTGSDWSMIRWSAFGEIISDPNSVDQASISLGYRGMEYDQQLSQHHASARQYDMRAGRFISAEPLSLPFLLSQANDQSNGYAYALGSPLMLADLKGRQAIPWSPGVRGPEGDLICPPTASDLASDEAQRWTAEQWPGEMSFHCGYSCYRENRRGGDEYRAQCCYDECGVLATDWCAGTKDRYWQSDPRHYGWPFDDGGPISINGLCGLVGSTTTHMITLLERLTIGGHPLCD
ncbi:MAG: hypothetical protein IPJ77_06055 [Planctomycetes bacterium]|nr:hypothetical protein [Planctomycetota bacterium]